jgi:hypothetical protein
LETTPLKIAKKISAAGNVRETLNVAGYSGKPNVNRVEYAMIVTYCLPFTI